MFYLGMEKLTLVQNLSLPLITAGFDCLIKSQTGSGKTLAYGIPLVQQLAAVEPKVVY
jgi:superfamily II DNA/RNA helicase